MVPAAIAALALPLAHGGRFTWDEALMVLAPILALGGLLWLANKRAKALQRDREAGLDTRSLHDETPRRPV